jgi:hypothetical protein
VSAATTFAPSRAKIRAALSPIPDAAPVTSAILFFSLTLLSLVDARRLFFAGFEILAQPTETTYTGQVVSYYPPACSKRQRCWQVTSSFWHY